MAQKLRELVALSEDPHLGPSTHIGWVTTIWNFSSKESDLSPGLHGHLNSHAHINTHIHNQIKIKSFLKGALSDVCIA